MKNKYDLNIYPLAKQDMEQIFDYIAVELCNPTASLKLANDFERALQQVCSFPESCPFVNNQYVKDNTLRKLIVNNYIIFYRVYNTEIQVVRVIYGMRNFESLL